jgi:hypothetical protein
MDDATQRRRLRNEVKQSPRLLVVLAHAALVPAFLTVGLGGAHLGTPAANRGLSGGGVEISPIERAD